MDFALIEEHPWATVALIGGGGLLLYLYWRGGSSSSAPQGGGGGYAAVDQSVSAQNAQLSAMQAQIQGQIAGLNIQGATQIQLAQIGATVSSQNIAATQDVQNTATLAALKAGTTQTSAELALGLGSQQSTVDLARIQATVQMAEIDALVRAYGGTPAGSGPTYDTTHTPPVAVNPVLQVSSTYSPPPTYQTPTQTVSGPGGGLFGGPVVPGGSPVAGGLQLVPTPAYESCNPRDSACVERNQAVNISNENNVLYAQQVNNQNQCRANAELNRGMPNYAALVAACR